jgi:hypothetical protein
VEAVDCPAEVCEPIVIIREQVCPRGLGRFVVSDIEGRILVVYPV